MNSQLREILDRSIERLTADPRVACALHFGSVGKQHEDALSDVDPIFFIHDEAFESLDRDLPELFRSICPQIRLWWPESCNNDEFRNYAIFFETGALLQYDVNIAKLSSLDGEFGRFVIGQSSPEHIFYDPQGRLAAALAARPTTCYEPHKLIWTVEQFWIYAYIHGKYLRRAHVFKLLYAQGMLMQAHCEVLRALYPEVHWHWWPDVAKRHLRPAHQQALLLYFGAVDAEEIGRRLARQMNLFAADARQACRAYDLPYPGQFEALVRVHLRALGFGAHRAGPAPRPDDPRD